MDLLLRLKRIFNLIKWNHHLIHIHLNSYFMSEYEKIFKLTNAHEKSNQILTNNAINFFPIVELRNGGGPHFDTVGLYVRDSALNGIPSLFIFSHLMAIEETEIIDTILHEYTHGIIEVANLNDEYSRFQIARLLSIKGLIPKIFKNNEDDFCEWFGKYLRNDIEISNETDRICKTIIDRYIILMNEIHSFRGN